MGSVKFTNPAELEDKKLDLEIRKKIILKKMYKEKQIDVKMRVHYDKVKEQLQKEEELHIKR